MSESRLEEAREFLGKWTEVILQICFDEVLHRRVGNVCGQGYDRTIVIAENEWPDVVESIRTHTGWANDDDLLENLQAALAAAERRGFEKAKEMAAECIPAPVSDSCPCNPCTEWRRYRSAIRAIQYPEDVLKEGEK